MWNTFGATVYFTCQWLITLVVVWLYDDLHNAGNLALAMNITNIFYCVAAYNMRAFQVSDVHGEYSDGAYVATRLLTCLGAGVLCALFVLITGYPIYQVIIVICYMIFRSVEAFTDVLHGIVHKHRRLDIAGISMTSRGLLMLGAFTVFGYFFELLPAIIGMTAATGLFCIFFDIPKAKKMADFAESTRIKSAGIPGSVRRLLRRCFPLMLTSVIIAFFAFFTRFLLERTYGTDAFGGYNSATIPAVAMQVAATFMLAPLINLFSECIKESDRAKFLRIFFISAALIGGLAAAAFLAAHLIGEWGLRLIFGDKILPYTHLLPGAMLANGLAAMLLFMNVVFSTLRDIKGIFFGCMAGIAVCVATTGLFLGEFGLNGANVALIVSQGAAFAILFVRLIWRFNSLKEKIYDKN